jgi:predicted O-linked N-acetylglucosamine transferase (SPINDLY family)
MKLTNYFTFLSFFFKDSPDLWREVDDAILSGDAAYAHTIYRHLTRRTPKTRENYLHIALAEYRLNNPSIAADILEAGIGKYPDSVGLREHYVFVCAKIGEIDRAIEFLRLDAHSPTNAYELLFNMVSDSSIRPSIAIALVEHCLKQADVLTQWGLADILLANGRHEDANHIYERLSKRELNTRIDYYYASLSELRLLNHKAALEILEKGQREFPEAPELVELDVLTQWGLADILLANGRHEDANHIYERLSKRELNTRIDYYYASLSEFRLLNHKAALEILEKGQQEFPEAREFLDSGFEICASYCDYDSYQRLVRRSRNESIVAPSEFEFLRLVIRRFPPICSFLNLKGLEFKLNENEIAILEQEFLLRLEEKSVGWDQARNLVFCCHYLDTDPAFASEIFRIVQSKIGSMVSDEKAAERVLQLLRELTPPMISVYSTPAAVLVDRFIRACHSLTRNAAELNEPIVDMTNNWVPWQHIFCLVAPTKYAEAMSAFERAAFQTWPTLAYVAPHTSAHENRSRRSGEKIRIGFLVHDSMPMLSGFLNQFDKAQFEMLYLRPGGAGKTLAAQTWIARAEQIIEYSDVDVFDAINTIGAQKLDILIAGPSVAAVFFPMMARLASLQMVLLEPNWTDGLRNSDYYISWAPAEPRNPEGFYRTSVAYLQHPPYWIEPPLLQSKGCTPDEMLSETRRRLLGVGSNGRIYLCANTPPKIHSEMDDIIYALLKRDPDAKLVLLRGDYPPAKNLKTRLGQKLGADIGRVVFLPTLGRQDAHLLLQSADCCLDSYPLCGMSSSFDAAMLGVPIVTLPAPIPFGSWTAAIYDYIGVTGLTGRDKSEYVDIAIRLANDRQWRLEKSLEIKTKASRYVESVESSNELQHFLLEAWNRKVSGLPSTNWISGRWEEASVH